MPIENNKLLPASGNNHVFSIAKVSAHTETTSEKSNNFRLTFKRSASKI